MATCVYADTCGVLLWHLGGYTIMSSAGLASEHQGFMLQVHIYLEVSSCHISHLGDLEGDLEGAWFMTGIWKGCGDTLGGSYAISGFAVHLFQFLIPIHNHPSPRTPCLSRYSDRHMPDTVKLIKLPTVRPMTRHSPMKPPAASRSPSSTQSPAAIMQLELVHPLVNPNSTCTTNK